MQVFKKMCIKAVIGLGVLFTTSFSANAALISQDVLDVFTGDKLGSVTVRLNNNLFDTGLVSSAFGDDVEVVDFELGDLYSWGDELDVIFADVDIDTNDLSAGIQFLNLDSNDVGFGPFTWGYQMNYEAFFGDGFLDIFQVSDGTLVDFYTITLGQATVVPAPATMGLMILAAGAIFIRRRRLV
ncbi:PEP-CTERM sorting domain-containing protein [Salinimonas chungwhensis]|uniref:PEP-CTERM sorting domain-containing protein n=1 Tax=Salinimonas chungwhensis TaxID=265425 RepID=UPI000370BBB4|nr:PEP-CTERM sorting domain-containing protein [Salinimonas chungwhensis]